MAAGAAEALAVADGATLLHLDGHLAARVGVDKAFRVRFGGAARVTLSGIPASRVTKW